LFKTLFKFEQVIFHGPLNSWIWDHYIVSKHQPSVLHCHGTTSRRTETWIAPTQKPKKLHVGYVLPGIVCWTVYSRK